MGWRKTHKSPRRGEFQRDVYRGGAEVDRFIRNIEDEAARARNTAKNALEKNRIQDAKDFKEREKNGTS